MVRFAIQFSRQVFATLFSALGQWLGALFLPFRQVRLPSMNKPALVASLALLAIVGSGIFLYTRLTYAPVSYLNQLQDSVATVGADETAKLLGDGRRVLVIEAKYDTVDPATERFQVSVRTAFQHARGFQVIGTEVVPVGRESSVALSADRYLGIVEAHRDADAIVSLIGAPALSPKDLKRLPANAPKLSVFDGDRALTQSLMAQGIVSLAFEARTARPSDAPAQPKTAREWFDANYQVVK